MNQHISNYLSCEVEPDASLIVEHQRQHGGAVGLAVQVKTRQSHVAPDLRICGVHEGLPVLVVSPAEGA